MAVFAYSALVSGNLQHGEVDAPDAEEARKLVLLRFQDIDATIRRIFEPPPRHGLRNSPPAERPRLNHRFNLNEPSVRKERRGGRAVHR